jgi:hypothetical protein
MNYVGIDHHRQYSHMTDGPRGTGPAIGPDSQPSLRDEEALDAPLPAGPATIMERIRRGIGIKLGRTWPPSEAP